MEMTVKQVYAIKDVTKLSERELNAAVSRMWRQIKGDKNNSKEVNQGIVRALGGGSVKHLKTRAAKERGLRVMLTMRAEKMAVSKGKTAKQKDAIRELVGYQKDLGYLDDHSVNEMVETAKATVEMQKKVSKMTDAEKDWYIRTLDAKINETNDITYANLKEAILNEGLVYDTNGMEAEDFINVIEDIDENSLAKEFTNGLTKKSRDKIYDMFENDDTRGKMFQWLDEMGYDTPDSETLVMEINDKFEEFCKRFDIKFSKRDTEKLIGNLAQIKIREITG